MSSAAAGHWRAIRGGEREQASASSSALFHANSMPSPPRPPPIDHSSASDIGAAGAQLAIRVRPNGAGSRPRVLRRETAARRRARQRTIGSLCAPLLINLM